MSILSGAIFGVFAVIKFSDEKINKYRDMSDKHLALFLMMNQWVKVKQEGKNLAEYLKNKGYKSIAIYGMSYVGETLVNELRNTDIDVKYGIDKNAATIYADIDTVSMDEELDKVDVIIVTAIRSFDQIKKELSDKTDCPVVSLEDILYLL